jgi:hypothetical protein
MTATTGTTGVAASSAPSSAATIVTATTTDIAAAEIGITEITTITVRGIATVAVDIRTGIAIDAIVAGDRLCKASGEGAGACIKNSVTAPSKKKGDSKKGEKSCVH